MVLFESCCGWQKTLLKTKWCDVTQNSAQLLLSLPWPVIVATSSTFVAQLGTSKKIGVLARREWSVKEMRRQRKIQKQPVVVTLIERPSLEERNDRLRSLRGRGLVLVEDEVERRHPVL